jgi:hypothetical protein
MATVRGFEARGVKLYVCHNDSWIIVRDGDMWISSRSLAQYLGYQDAHSLLRALHSDSSLLCDRLSFPASILKFPNEGTAHWFVKVAGLVGGAKLLVQAKLDLIPPLLGSLLKYVAMWALDVQDECNRLQRQPQDRRSLTLAAPTKRDPSVDATHMHLIRGPHIVMQKVIRDVDIPPPHPRVVQVYATDSSRLHFQDIEFNSEEAGSDFRPSRPPSMAEAVAGFLRRRGQVVQDEILREAGPPVDNTSLEARIFDALLRSKGDLNRVPTPQYHEITLPPCHCPRNIDEMRRCASHHGHLVSASFAGSESCRMSWIISLDLFDLTAAHRRALEYYRRVRTVTLFSSQSCVDRKWWLSSTYVTSDELSRLATVLFDASIPDLPIPHILETRSGSELVDMNPWLRSTSTSLGSDESTDYDSFVMTSHGLIGFATALVQMGRDLTDRKCLHDVIASLNKVGVGANIVVSCSKCSIKIAVSSCGDKDMLRKFNRVAYAMREMSGRPQAVDRFLAGLGIGAIIERNGAERFSHLFAKAVQVVYHNCERVMAAALVSVPTGDVKASADVFHMRNSRQGQLGAAKASGVSFGIPGFRKIVSVFVAPRGIIDESRDVHGVAHIPSPLGELDLTAKRKGVEHQLVELAFQYFKQLLEKGKIWAVKSLEGKIDEIEISRIRAQVLNCIVTDALTSAPASAQEAFGSSVSMFVDWWHRRTSWKKLLDKVETKKAKGKAPRYPLFAGLKETLGSVWSDVQYDRKPFSDFQQRAEEMVRASGVDFRSDTEHQKRWEKLMEQAKKLYEATHVDLGTSLNEQFHSHTRFFAVKGDNLSPRRWHTLVQCAYLSFNNYPSWRTLVVDEFLRISLEHSGTGE